MSRGNAKQLPSASEIRAVRVKGPVKTVVSFWLPADVQRVLDREKASRGGNRSAALVSIVREWAESKKSAKAKKSAQRNGAAKGK
jgi:hypothetical protein